MPNIVTIVLAAGASRRLGRPKQLLPVRGLPLVRTIVAEARASACDRVAVVVGAAAGLIAPVLDDLDVTILWNGGWREGVASSIRAGVRWAAAIDADAAILCPCDQPRLDRAQLDRLIAASEGGARAVASRYQHHPGVPALYPRAIFPALLALRGDHGTRAVLTPEIELEWPDGAIRIDTPADLELVTGRTA
jgi:CTP:molybdopterin cytidylyltransferase MocA